LYFVLIYKLYFLTSDKQALSCDVKLVEKQDFFFFVTFPGIFRRYGTACFP